jgi:hypothetical protein
MSVRAGWLAMTQLTFAIAATHDHWFEEPTARYVYPAARLWWRHFSKQHSFVADTIEWSACGVLGVGVLVGSLIANA